MGIFAERHIKKGEELVFNYNVDRYGADPQPCYCGEPNCTGYIGGKTQTERGTQLSNATIQALGIDDYDDWEFAVAKKPRKARKTGENDEEYVNDVEPKSLEEDGVTKVMAALMQCKEKWIAVKLLGRIQRVKDERVINRVVRMHGYRILKTALSNFLGDSNVCLQVLDILSHVPRITRNKIQESQIEKVVEKLKESEDEKLKKQATDMLEIWRKLEVGYRIPRIKRDPNATVRNERPERRDARDVRERSRSRSKSPVAPSGPKSSIPQRNPGYFNGSHQPFRRAQFTNLPTGWFAAMAKDNRMYYYSSSGETTWRIPREPAMRPPPPPPLEFTYYNMLQQIIDNVTKNNTPKERSPAVPIPQPAPEVKEVKKEAKWRSLSEDKQKKLYENTVGRLLLLLQCGFH
jgi:histone-lysine N-methyltransferase SETD2